jgi:Family of unknown function (DUF6188)
MSELRQREDGAWVVPVSGARIESVRWEGNSYAILQLAGGDEISMMLPERVEIGGRVREATFTDDGVLTIALEDGTVLESRCDPKVENWEIRADRVFVVPAVGDDSVNVWEWE